MIRFINNEFVPGVAGRTFETINPHDEKPIVAVHEGDDKDIDIAVKAARTAFEGEWKHVTPSERGRLLLRLADLLERERERRRRVEEQRQQVTEVPTTRSSSSVNSLGNGRELYPTPPPASAPSLHTYPPPPAHELRKHPSSRSLRSTNDPEPPVPGPSSSRVTRRVRRDPYDFDDGDEDELPTRTPHAETYATIDPAQVELLRQNQSRIDSDQGRSLIRRILGRSQSTTVGGPPSASIDGSFKAPWLTLAPRAKQEEHERVVANLNESFIDVGLLPSFVRSVQCGRISGIVFGGRYGSSKPRAGPANGRT